MHCEERKGSKEGNRRKKKKKKAEEKKNAEKIKNVLHKIKPECIIMQEIMETGKQKSTLLS